MSLARRPNSPYIDALFSLEIHLAWACGYVMLQETGVECGVPNHKIGALESRNQVVHWVRSTDLFSTRWS